MNDTVMVTTFVLLDDLMQGHGHRTDVRAAASDSEVLTVAVFSACQFGNHERALCVLQALGYLSGALWLSRFNRYLHALAHWFTLPLNLVCERFACDTVAFTLDSLPVPVPHRGAPHRCRL